MNLKFMEGFLVACKGLSIHFQDIGRDFRVRNIRSILLAMKLISAIILIGALHISAAGLGQKITFSGTSVPLSYVFNAITEQTGYGVFISHSILEAAKPVSMNMHDATIDEVLQKCFSFQPWRLGYTITGHTISITRKESITIATPFLAVPPDVVGTVRSEDGNPLAGATIEIIKLNKKGITNEKGEFSLKGVPNGKYDVKITYVGYDTYLTEIIVEDHQVQLLADLKQSSNSLDQVQIIAYGTTTKRLNTGNVSTVKVEDIEKEPINNPLLALQGNVPGIEIQQMGGLSASPIRVSIRGYNSFKSGTDPLYIIDGVPYTSQTLRGTDLGVISDGNTGNPFSFINPADIESIDVLKDADATAIYGSRGANGVILITTKRGKAGQTKADINIQTGWGKVGHFMKLLNTSQYVTMRNEAFKNDGATPNPTADYDLTLWDTTRYTDWQKELIGGTAQYTDIQASVSGGNVYTQYLIGTGYHKETTVFPNSNNDQKGSLHINMSSKSLDKKFKLTFSGLYSVDNNQLGSYDYTVQALQLAPDAPAMYNPDGSINWAPNAYGVSTWPTTYFNPAANAFTKFQTRTNNLIGNGTIGYEIIPGLEIKTSLGYTNMQTNQFEATPFTAIDPSLWSVWQRTSYFGNNNIQSWIIEPQLIFNRHIDKGLLTILTGSTLMQNKTNGQVLTGYGFNSDLLMGDLNSATKIIPSSLNGISLYKYNAGFGRLNYNWEDKYLLNLTARRDGSSRFGPASQFHNFWAWGAGWIFSKEDFIQKCFPMLSFGKLRASYGTTGNDQVGNYSYLDLYSSQLSIQVPYQGVTGLIPNIIFNPNLAWEETAKLEAGLELGFFKDRINFSSSFYRNRSSNQLLPYPLSGVTGFTSVTKNLNALLQNKGWEFQLRTVNVNWINFRWTSSFNLSLNRNKIISVPQDISEGFKTLVGHSIRANAVYHFLGVDPITGVNQFEDKQGHSTFTPNPSTDANTFIDPTTKFYGGFQNSFSYEGLQLDILFQFAKVPESIIYYSNIIPGNYSAGIRGSNQPLTVLNRWQKPGDVSTYPRFSANSSLLNSYLYAQISDRVYGDASYIRLKNLSLSWQLPEHWRKSSHLQQARIFIHSQNLFTITKYQGFDPESGAIALPPLKVVTVGVQLTI